MESLDRKSVVLFMQTLFGAILATKGFDGFVNFLPQAEQTAVGAGFIAAIKETGYLFYLLKGVEVLCGAMLVMNIFVPITLVVLAPVVLNIVLFELFLNFSVASMILPVIVSVCEVFLLYHYRNLFLWLFRYQVHTDLNSYESPEVIIMSEVKENDPEAYDEIKKIDKTHHIISH